MPPTILLKKVEPKYPKTAKASRIEGVVVLNAIIDKKGHITTLQVMSGPEILANEAVEAVKQWEYEPYKYKGAVIEIQTTITVTFALGHHKKKN
jgi:protein TonB